MPKHIILFNLIFSVMPLEERTEEQTAPEIKNLHLVIPRKLWERIIRYQIKKKLRLRVDVVETMIDEALKKEGF